VTDRVRLGYPFFPVPRWVLRDVGVGRLSHQGYALVTLLYERANPEALARRAATPNLTLDYLAEAIRWTHQRDSLRRFIGRLRAEGRWFDYQLSGSPRTGIRYDFCLFADAPSEAGELSGDCPPNVVDPRPLTAESDDPHSSTASPIDEARRVRQSASNPRRTPSAKAPDVSAKNAVATPPPQRAFRPSNPDPVRLSRDGRRETKALSEENNHYVLGTRDQEDRLFEAVVQKRVDDEKEEPPWRVFQRRLAREWAAALPPAEQEFIEQLRDTFEADRVEGGGT
jgi:hypothetical protein